MDNTGDCGLDTPGEFFDPVAPVYDAQISSAEESQRAADVRFYLELAREAAGPVLELGVGTGRIYLELLEEGIDADGIDLSAGMLDELRTAAEERGLDPAVWNQDITQFDPAQQYELIYAPNRVFNHLATVDEQRAALQNICRALAPDGRFVLNTFVPKFAVIVETYGEPRETVVETDEDSYRILSTTSLNDEVEQVARLHREVYRGNELVAQRETPLALIPKRQFELLFELTGFDRWDVYGGFDRSPLESADDEMVWIVRE
jgi:SAM-dependent methyltransferase